MRIRFGLLIEDYKKKFPNDDVSEVEHLKDWLVTFDVQKEANGKPIVYATFEPPMEDA